MNKDLLTNNPACAIITLENIYFDTNCHYETTVWVEDNATEEEIKEKLYEEALSNIEFEWHEHF